MPGWRNNSRRQSSVWPRSSQPEKRLRASRRKRGRQRAPQGESRTSNRTPRCQTRNDLHAFSVCRQPPPQSHVRLSIEQAAPCRNVSPVILEKDFSKGFVTLPRRCGHQPQALEFGQLFEIHQTRVADIGGFQVKPLKIGQSHDVPGSLAGLITTLSLEGDRSPLPNCSTRPEEQAAARNIAAHSVAPHNALRVI